MSTPTLFAAGAHAAASSSVPVIGLMVTAYVRVRVRAAVAGWASPLVADVHGPRWSMSRLWSAALGVWPAQVAALWQVLDAMRQSVPTVLRAGAGLEYALMRVRILRHVAGGMMGEESIWRVAPCEKDGTWSEHPGDGTFDVPESWLIARGDAECDARGAPAKPLREGELPPWAAGVFRAGVEAALVIEGGA